MRYRLENRLARREYRRRHGDAWFFNWRLTIDPDFQDAFDPTHEAMASLSLGKDQPVNELAANLRRAFSGIVAGNVKDEGIRRIEDGGPFVLHGDPDMVALLDRLLEAFVAQQRMRLPGFEYKPCYQLASWPRPA